MKSCPTAACCYCPRTRILAKRQPSRTMLLVVSVSVTLLVLCTTANAADAYRKHQPRSRQWVENAQAVWTASVVRGGAKAAEAQEDEEAAELDAYIEQLLQDAAGEDQQPTTSKTTTRRKGDKTKKATTTTTTKTAVKTVKRKTKKSKESLESDNDSTSSTRIKKPSKKLKQRKTVTKKTATTKKTIASSDSASMTDSWGATNSSVNQTLQELLDNNTTLPCNEHANQTLTEATVANGDSKIAAAEAAAATTTTTTNHDSEPRQQLQRPPPPPPNGLYRFLLHRAGGFGGRALVLMLVTASEFLHTYIPAAAAAGDWVWCNVFPPPKGGRRRRRGAPPPSSSVNAASVSHMVRTGVSRKKRRKFTKQADQHALRQLQQGHATTSEIRYAFCSRAFCQRHGLGKWASTSSKPVANDGTGTMTVVSMEEDASVQSSVGAPLVQEPTGGSKKVRKKKQDWVLAALTKEPPKHKTTPTLTLEMGSQGLTLGVELDWSGRKERVRAALTLPSTKSKRSSAPSNTSPRKSDADGGVLGRLRTAAGSSALRSLSGAYPGDALAVNEAGNALGLSDFASKYGYGDWSSEEEDEDDLGFGARSRRKRSRKRPRSSKHSFGSDDDMEFSFSSTGSSSSTRKTRRAPRSLSPEIALSSSSLSRNKEALSNRKRMQSETSVSSNRRSDSPAKTVTPRRVEMPKLALARTKELLEKSKSTKSSDDE